MSCCHHCSEKQKLPFVSGSANELHRKQLFLYNYVTVRKQSTNQSKIIQKHVFFVKQKPHAKSQLVLSACKKHQKMLLLCVSTHKAITGNASVACPSLTSPPVPNSILSPLSPAQPIVSTSPWVFPSFFFHLESNAKPPARTHAVPF